MIAAFDIGIKNFAFAIKDTNEKNNFILLNNTSLNDALTKTDLNKYTKQQLSSLVPQGTLRSNTTKKDLVSVVLKGSRKNSSGDLCKSLFAVMDNYTDFWAKCDIFLIERQIKANMQALKLSHFLEAYLKIYYPLAVVVNYTSSAKTKNLGAVDLKDKKSRKKWTVAYTENLLLDDNLKYFQSLPKQDDVADTVCMIEAFIKDKQYARIMAELT